MKGYLILLAAILLTVTATMAQDKAKTFTQVERYDAQNRQLMGQRNPGNRVVLMGNSITDLWDDVHPQFFADHPNLINRGICGQTTYHFLTRFRSDVIDLKPKVVVIGGATNDIAENDNIAYSEEHTFGNIMTMVELAKAHKIKVVLTSVLPASQFSWAMHVQGVQLRIMRLNSRIKAYAAAQSIPYIDYYTPLVSGPERSLNPAYTTDGVHPNAAGYAIMEPLLINTLKNLKIKF